MDLKSVIPYASITVQIESQKILTISPYYP